MQIEPLEPSIREQFVQFSRKHLPDYLIRYLDSPLLLKILSKLLCIEEIYRLEEKFRDTRSYKLVDALISYTGITCTCENISKVPSAGRLLLVANHPLGGADWLLIVQSLSVVRKDLKVVINKDVHTLMTNMRDLFIPVDQYASFNDVARKQIRESLEKEEAVLIFPSGGISIMTLSGVKDRRWKNGVVHFSREHYTDILPIYISGRFSLAFYLYPIRLRRFLLLRKLLHPGSRRFRLVIGDKISYKEMSRGTDISNISARLRSVTYQLAGRS